MENEVKTAIGLMSGTSLDGIDAAIIQTDGETIFGFGECYSLEYSSELKDKIRDAIKHEKNIEEVSKLITEKHAEAVNSLLKEAELKNSDIDVIGFHGQTIKHDPDNGVTIQIGDGKLLAQLTGIDVINDLRTNDVKNGGQGAPLVPLYHQALLKLAKEPLPVAIVNIGGVANVTYISDDTIIAFDTGPGNALIDDWVLKNSSQGFDVNGQYAFDGEINEEILAQLVSHQYFDKVPPKSLDRDEFATDIINSISLEDGAATLSVFTISSIIMADHHFPEEVKSWYITGGGRHNEFIMEGLKTAIDTEVYQIEELGFDGDMIEAEAFAFLAVRSLYKLPLTLPSTTGVKEPITGGILNVA